MSTAIKFPWGRFLVFVFAAVLCTTVDATASLRNAGRLRRATAQDPPPYSAAAPAPYLCYLLANAGPAAAPGSSSSTCASSTPFSPVVTKKGTSVATAAWTSNAALLSLSGNKKLPDSPMALPDACGSSGLAYSGSSTPSPSSFVVSLGGASPSRCDLKSIVAANAGAVAPSAASCTLCDWGSAASAVAASTSSSWTAFGGRTKSLYVTPSVVLSDAILAVTCPGAGGACSGGFFGTTSAFGWAPGTAARLTTALAPATAQSASTPPPTTSSPSHRRRRRL